MYDKNDKRRLGWLLDEYLAGRIDESCFCVEFYYSFDLEIEKKDLTSSELTAYTELDFVASRFSPFEADHRLDSHAFSTVEELRQKIVETKNKLCTNPDVPASEHL